MAQAAGHLFQMEEGSIGAVGNTGHPCQTTKTKPPSTLKYFVLNQSSCVTSFLFGLDLPVTFDAGTASICMHQASHTGLVTLQTVSLIWQKTTCTQASVCCTINKFKKSFGVGMGRYPFFVSDPIHILPILIQY